MSVSPADLQDGTLDGVTILLDLDGTLTDSAPGIVASMQYTVDKLALGPLPADARSRFVGPPMHDNLRHLFELTGATPTQEQLDQAVVVFREYYVPIGMFDNAVYDGVPEMVSGLMAAGARLAVATSKAEPYALQVIEHFGMTGCFAAIVGSTLDGARSSKADIIGEALARLGEPDSGRTVMVGDRSHDVHGARAHGIACYGAGWGYGANGELEAAGVISVMSDPRQLRQAIQSRFAGVRTS